MVLHKKTYKAYDAILLAFKLSPAWMAIHMLLSLAQAIMPTAVMALATANFVDTAIAILHRERLYGDIFLPLILLLLVLGLAITLGSGAIALGPVSQLILARISLDMRLKLAPAVVQAHALLDFKHIENADSGSVSPSRARCLAARPSRCWTNPPPPWIPSAKAGYTKNLNISWMVKQPCSLAIA